MADQQGGQKKGKKFSITAPKARLGDRVQVLNYRMRPAAWVEGVVSSVEAKEIFRPGFSWTYAVGVDSPNLSRSRRFGRFGDPVSYVLYVGDRSIKPIDVRDADGHCKECGNRIGHAMSCQSDPGGLGVSR